MSWQRSLRCCAFVLVASACDPYKDYKLKGEFDAGSADPFNYPPPFRGAGATRNIAGSGNGFTAVRAFAPQGIQVQYYLFPYSPSQVVTAGYSAITLAAQTSNARNIRQFPLAYAFDPPNSSSPFPAQQQCRAPEGYQYDPRRDDVRYDEQGNIFTALPEATFGQGSLPTWTYYPIVREVAVRSNGESCQAIKSERTLLSRNDVHVPTAEDGSSAPDGRYLVWALIDPGSGVYRVGETASNSTGVGVQRWGWFQQFLVAYIDGGYVPQASTTQFATQRLFIPRANVILDCATNQDCLSFAGTARGAAVCETSIGRCRTSTQCTTDAACGTGATCDTAVGFCRQPATGSPARLSVGYEIMEAARGSAGYSPICEVFTYKPSSDPALASSLPRDPATILNDPGTYGPLQRPPAPVTGSIVPNDVIPPYVFCLQAQ